MKGLYGYGTKYFGNISFSSTAQCVPAENLLSTGILIEGDTINLNIASEKWVCQSCFAISKEQDCEYCGTPRRHK